MTAEELLKRIEQYIISRNSYAKECRDKSAFLHEVYYDGRVDSYEELLNYLIDIKSDLKK